MPFVVEVRTPRSVGVDAEAVFRGRRVVVVFPFADDGVGATGESSESGDEEVVLFSW